MIQLFLGIMVLFAVLAIQTNKLRNAVIYLGVFSLASSFCYLLYNAPDVAIAEAVIGSTLVTILYLIALKKYRVFTIYNTRTDYNQNDEEHFSRRNGQILKLIEEFCVSRELEPQIIKTTHTPFELDKEHQYDLIIRLEDGCVYISGNKKNYQMNSLQEYINTRIDTKAVPVVYEDREGDL